DGVQHTGAFTGAGQVAVQGVELHRVPGHGLAERAAAGDAVPDVHQHVAHARVLLAAAQDLEGLHHGHAGLQHRGDLPAEDGDFLGGDGLAGVAEQRLALGPHHRRVDALLAQLGLEQVGILGRALALHLDAALVGALPDELLERIGARSGGILRGSSRRHGLVLGHAVDFGQAGDALLDLPEGRLAQVAYAGGLGGLGDLQRIAALEDDLLDAFGHGHHLIDADTALVTVVALVAAHRLVDGEAGGDLFRGVALGQ